MDTSKGQYDASSFEDGMSNVLEWAMIHHVAATDNEKPWTHEEWHAVRGMATKLREELDKFISLGDDVVAGKTDAATFAAEFPAV